MVLLRFRHFYSSVLSITDTLLFFSACSAAQEIILHYVWDFSATYSSEECDDEGIFTSVLLVQGNALILFTPLVQCNMFSMSDLHVFQLCKLTSLFNLRAWLSDTNCSLLWEIYTFNTFSSCYICLLSHASVKWRHLTWINFPGKAIINSQEMGKLGERAPALDFTAGFHRAPLFLPIPALERLQFRPWMGMISSILHRGVLSKYQHQALNLRGTIQTLSVFAAVCWNCLLI